MQHEKILIVGAGISGATIGRRFAETGAKVDIIEKRDHVAGNCYDYINEHGIRVNQYGPHFFHTNSERVWAWVNRFSEWTPWCHRVIGCIGEERKLVPVPANRTTINTLFGLNMQTDAEVEAWLKQETAQFQSDKPPQNSEEVALQRVGRRLYDLLFKGYTKKQWEKDASELDASVLARIPVRVNDDDRYFGDVHQALPTNGYTAFAAEMLNHPLISVKTDVDYLACPEAYRQSYTKTFFCGPIDSYFSSLGFDALEYRSLRFEYVDEEVSSPEAAIWPAAQVNFPSESIPYTRLSEYKNMLHQKANKPVSTVVYEYSQSHGDPYYPVPNQRNQDLFAKYKAFADKEVLTNRVYFVGRLACYKYYNMDQAMLAALEFADNFVPHEEKLFGA
jgi:UDP-galactopyranose mutase